MPLSRRKMLFLIGGGVVVAATAGFLTTRTPQKALAPWATAGGYQDLRKWALSYALLAPNPHNRQPWIADLSVADQVTLYRDPVLNLPETDPLDRQLTIGMGCFVELLVMAAAQRGIKVSVQLFPQGTGADKPVAVARFGGAASPDPLFSQVLHRHTNRFPYDAGQGVEPLLQAVRVENTDLVQVGGSDAGAQVTALQNLAVAAVEMETHTPRTHKETIDLTRIGKAEINANPDGISLGGALMDSLALLGVLDRVSALDPASRGFAASLRFQTDAIRATPAFFWLTSKGNSRLDQIAAGRVWLRAHLQATALGGDVQPLSQALQEYAEMASLYQQAHQMLAPEGGTVQMLGRLGFGPATGPAPRWPLETRLKHV